MTRRVLLLVSAHLLVGSMLLGLDGRGLAGTSVVVLGAFAVLYAVLDLVPLHLELRRHAHTITITEAVLVAAAFHLPPAGVVAAAVLGEVTACVTTRLSPLQVSFNVAQTFGAASLASVVFAAIGPDDPTTGLAWLAAFAAAGAFATVSMVSVASVLTIVDATPFRRIVGVTSVSTCTTALASAALGLAMLTLAEGTPAGPLLLAPVVALVVLESKRITDASAERLRFERLYEASSRTARLSLVEEAVTVLADEARNLLTGAQAICCAQVEGGGWSGVIVDDEGPRPVDVAAVGAILALAEAGTVEIGPADVPAVVRSLYERDSEIVVAPSDPDTGSQVVLAVVAPHGGEKRQRHLSGVLSAFAGTAALAIGNARLYAEVEAALQHQLDLNRQKAEFVATVSHELRTPLASVLGSVQTIQRLGSRLSEEDAELLLDAALGQGARLRRLIEDLLLVAATEHETVRTNPAPVAISHLLDQVRTQFATAHGGGEVRIEVDPLVGTMSTDEDKLQRILTNLIENAVKYASGGPVEVVVTSTGPGTSFVVSDHGPGIPEQDRDRVFERFVQLDQTSTRRQGGTGLGLHLCRSVATLLGGTLTVGDRSDGDPGAAFELVLPDLPTAEGPGHPSPHDHHRRPPRTGRRLAAQAAS